MKFKLTDTDSFWWPVRVRVPDPDKAGEVLTQTLEMKFAPQDQDEVLAQQETYNKLRTARERVDHEREQLQKICLDWRGLEGDPPFNAENFAKAIGKAWFRQAVYEAYSDSLSGTAALTGN